MANELWIIVLWAFPPELSLIMVSLKKKSVLSESMGTVKMPSPPYQPKSLLNNAVQSGAAVARFCAVARLERFCAAAGLATSRVRDKHHPEAVHRYLLECLNIITF